MNQKAKTVDRGSDSTDVPDDPDSMMYRVNLGHYVTKENVWECTFMA
jgi:hypothetical protein